MGKIEGLIVTLLVLVIVVLLMIAAGNFAQHVQTMPQAIECCIVGFVIVVVYACSVRYIVGRS